MNAFIKELYTSTEDLADLIHMLRKSGVREFRCGELSFTLYPEQPTLSAQTPQQQTPSPAEREAQERRTLFSSSG